VKNKPDACHAHRVKLKEQRVTENKTCDNFTLQITCQSTGLRPVISWLAAERCIDISFIKNRISIIIYCKTIIYLLSSVFVLQIEVLVDGK